MFLVGPEAPSGGLLLGDGFEEELKDVAGGEVGGQVEEGAVALALAAGAVGFAAGGEALDQGCGQIETAGERFPTKETDFRGKLTVKTDTVGVLLSESRFA